MKISQGVYTPNRVRKFLDIYAETASMGASNRQDSPRNEACPVESIAHGKRL
jgi:hypothetical protein